MGAVATGVRMRTGVVVALGVALIWSLALAVAAFTLPVYSGEIVTESGSTSTTATLVEINGMGVLGVVLAPLAATLVVAALVVMRRRRPVLGALAWVTVSLLAVLTVAALASIGLFFLPVVIALAVAVALSKDPAPAG